MSKKQKTAIFDIDGTLFRSSLLIEMVEGLIKKGIFPPETKERYEREKISWLERKGPYEDYIDAVIVAFTENIKGVPYSDFIQIGEETVKKMQWQTYTYTRSLIKNLKNKGYYLLAISQSPKGILDKFCCNFEFDKVYGRIYDLGPGDRFTGDVKELHLIANKANIVRRAVERENLTLEESVGVGDTECDISFLEMVTYPVCFNPNRGLHRHAMMNKWNVIVERKDVIYSINISEPYPDVLDHSGS